MLISRLTVILFVLIISFSTKPLYSQKQKFYSLKWKNEAIHVGIGITLHYVAGKLVDRVDKITENDLMILDASTVNSFDRGVIDNYSTTALTLSDIFLYTSYAVPFISLLDPAHSEEGLAVGLMAIETLLYSNGITNIAKAVFPRYRPYTYNQNLDLELQLTKGAKKSFFSGHTSTSAALSFFTATVVTDLHPELKSKWLVWTTASLIPAAVGVFRMKGGQHFPTDVIAGYIWGAFVGTMVPIIHRSNNVRLHLHSTNTIALTYTF